MSLASHQLRTPLTILKWSYGRLEKSIGDRATETEAKIVREARGATERMSQTINTMLAIARIESGSVHAENLEMKLGQRLQEIRTALRYAYERKHQTMAIECLPNTVIRTDPFIFGEIVHNLLTNSIKYTQEGGLIRVSVDAPEHHIRISVSDNGMGIPAHQQHKIFQKFFRGENVVQEDTEGTGLGLYLVHLLVKMLHGSISFVSEEGKGTVFTLLLPASPSAYAEHSSR